jgi:hypothetical protein
MHKMVAGNKKFKRGRDSDLEPGDAMTISGVKNEELTRANHVIGWLLEHYSVPPVPVVSISRGFPV